MKATQAIDAREKVTQGALGIFAWKPDSHSISSARVYDAS